MNAIQIRSLIDARATVGLGLVLGAAVVTAGWLWHVPALVQIVPGSKSMVLQTAWCFAIAGIGLFTASRTDARWPLHIVGAMLMLVALLALCEMLTGTSLVIDLASMHEWNRDGNAAPGRMAPNTAVGFFLAGLAFLLEPHRGHAPLRVLGGALAGLLVVLGVTGLAAYLLGLEGLYVWYAPSRLNQMSGPTAGAFVVLGMVLAYRPRETAAAISSRDDERRIVLASGLILAVVAALAGIAAFAVFEKSVRRLANDRLLTLADNRARTAESEIAQRVAFGRLIANRPEVLRSLARLNVNAADGEALKTIDDVARSSLPLGLGGISFLRPDGGAWVTAGAMAAAGELALDLGGSVQTTLVWTGRFTLRTRLPILRGDHMLGYAVIDHNLPLLTELVFSGDGLGETGEVQLCALRDGLLRCFPTRFAAQPIGVENAFARPIERALAGERGVHDGRDYRGVEVLAAYRPVGQLGLGMVVKQNLAEVYRPIREQLQFTLLILGALVLAGALLLWWRIRPLARRLVTSEQAARRIAADIEEKNRELVEHGTAMKLFRAAIDSSADAVYLIDRATMRVIDVNEATSRMLGYTRGEFLGMPVEEVFDGHTRADLEREYDALFASPTRADRREAIQRRRDGNTIPVEIQRRALDVDGVEILVGVARDITDRKRDEAESLERQRWLQEGLREIEDRHEGMMLLGKMSSVLQSCLTVEEALDAVKKFGPRVLRGWSGALYLSGRTQRDLDLATSWDSESVFVGLTAGFAPDACWALRRGQPHTSSDLGDEPICYHVRSPGDGRGRYRCLPLIVQGEALGLLHLSAHTEGVDRAAAPIDETLLVMVTEHISLALANIRLRETLREQSIRDALTGLYNRRLLEESLRRELSRAARKERALAVVVLDIDHFKQFNDTCGHDAGDLVLREVAGVVRRSIRDSDTACRFGGEEFVILLPEAGVEDARKRAEQIRTSISRMRLVHNGRELGTITASFGVAGFPVHGSQPEALLQAADAALYTSKREGRDRVTVAGGAPRPPHSAEIRRVV